MSEMIVNLMMKSSEGNARLSIGEAQICNVQLMIGKAFLMVVVGCSLANASS